MEDMIHFDIRNERLRLMNINLDYSMPEDMEINLALYESMKGKRIEEKDDEDKKNNKKNNNEIQEEEDNFLSIDIDYNMPDEMEINLKIFEAISRSKHISDLTDNEKEKILKYLDKEIEEEKKEEEEEEEKEEETKDLTIGQKVWSIVYEENGLDLTENGLDSEKIFYNTLKEIYWPECEIVFLEAYLNVKLILSLIETNDKKDKETKNDEEEFSIFDEEIKKEIKNENENEEEDEELETDNKIKDYIIVDKKKIVQIVVQNL